MPRKTKEQKELENENKEEKVTKKATTTTKKASTKKASTTKAKDTTGKRTTTRKNKSDSSTTKKATTSRTSKTSTTKKAPKKSASKKVATDNTKPKTTSARKSTTKKSAVSSKKSVATKKKISKIKTMTKLTRKKVDNKKKKIEIVEYYDLPYRYNQTVVKVLAQTPKNLFIYWDISDEDRKNFEEQYGENFFETTRPILIVHNDTLGYSFEIEINDFANSWYLHVNDSKCNYRVELGRRPIIKTEKLNTDYIYVSMSNEIESPNDHILFDKNQKMVYFRNVKTGTQTTKDITSISFIRNMGKIYNIYDLYKAIYKDENIEEIYNLSNPSSGNPSSRKYFIIIKI